MGDDSHGRFVEIYERAYGPLLGYALRRCQEPDDAADVVAETFTIAWRRVDEIPKGDEARLWLFGVARKVLANHRRGERRHEQRTAALREQLAVSPLLSHMPEDDLSQVGRIFRQLSDDDRELLSLVAWEKLDIGQIARTFDISRNAARVRLHRARRRFARGMAKAGIDHPNAITFERSTV
ncbi:RNA polymerase sigma factor [Sphaerisporangium fuscum]|uniref:RNA polymerase sigma factor n=1 Tax=Sphaerisporangium fuscum TaxID=2835868 RepID=UPI001BDCFB1B|nr:sigma-70 family RNA polymerase sigma factor [Sphaerisporangium fuscum]